MGPDLGSVGEVMPPSAMCAFCKNAWCAMRTGNDEGKVVGHEHVRMLASSACQPSRCARLQDTCHIPSHHHKESHGVCVCVCGKCVRVWLADEGCGAYVEQFDEVLVLGRIPPLLLQPALSVW